MKAAYLVANIVIQSFFWLKIRVIIPVASSYCVSKFNSWKMTISFACVIISELPAYAEDFVFLVHAQADWLTLVEEW